MGLDSYLYKRKYINQPYSPTPVPPETVVLRGTPVRVDRLTYAIEEVGYWRKFNALHQWFVTTVQSGADDCRDSPAFDRTTLEQLRNLLEQCRVEGQPTAEQLLPPQSGFFFGGAGFDTYYWDNVRRTIALLDDILAEDDDDEYYYRGSW